MGNDRENLKVFLKECDIRVGFLGSKLDDLGSFEGELLVKLKLSNQSLSALPDSIGSFTDLRELDLSSNLLTTLPASVANLTNLQQLDIGMNQLPTLPATVGKLTNLRQLLLYNNQLTTLPDSIGNLTNLQKLLLHRNNLSSIPASIGNLTKLKELVFENNQLTALPATIGKLTNLHRLNLSHNQLTTLPATIGKLTNLRELILYDNQLKTLPATIGNLTNLTKLNLEDNQPLTTLPGSICQMSQLRYLNLENTGLRQVKTYGFRVEEFFNSYIPCIEFRKQRALYRQNLTQFVQFQLQNLRETYNPASDESPQSLVQANLSEKFPAFFQLFAPRYHKEVTEETREEWWDECLQFAQPILEELEQLSHLTNQIKEVKDHYQADVTKYETEMLNLEERSDARIKMLQQRAEEEKLFLGIPSPETQTELEELENQKTKEADELQKWFDERKQWRDEQINQLELELQKHELSTQFQEQLSEMREAGSFLELDITDMIDVLVGKMEDVQGKKV